MSARVRVLVVDDSPLCRRATRRALEESSEFEIVGEAEDGVVAVELTADLQPDVVVMDVVMPRMNGLDALAEIMAASPTPVLVLSGDAAASRKDLAYEALRRGAVELLAKDLIGRSTEGRAKLRSCVRFLATVPVVRHLKPRRPSAPPRAVARGAASLIAIAASTGGPAALARILAGAPPDGTGVLLVQHLPPGFVEGLATWLNRCSGLEVRVARDGDVPRRGLALVAPDEAHLTLNRQRVVRLERPGSPAPGYCPSADRLFHSVAEIAGEDAVGVVLSGMGEDGASGLRALRLAGAQTIVQDEASCVVFGMPGAALRLDSRHLAVDLDAIAPTLQRMTQGAR